MRILLDWFDHPEKSFFPILIAGTKGKGSTGFFLESILVAAKIPAGFYSSPHLEDPRERIRINGSIISKAEWIRGVKAIRRILSKHRCHPDSERSGGEGSPRSFVRHRTDGGLRMTPATEEIMAGVTYFEILTLLAFLSFQKAGVRVGIFEVGMGGRLDATNVLNARLAILTPIHLDHQEFLGHTIAKIAAEKAAIIRLGANVIMSPQLPEARQVIESFARKQKAKLWPVRPVNFSVGLEGEYQRMNAGAAVAAARFLALKPSRRALQKSDWPGRFEIFKGHPTFILDGAHNPASIAALTTHLKKKFPRNNSLLIFGTSRDKDSVSMLKILSGFFYSVIITRSQSPRSQEIGTLLGQARGRFRRMIAAGTVLEAIRLAKSMTAPSAKVIITGSFYLIGEARGIIKGNTKT